mmetsp:Transcript_25613/g.44777  ORF Transcript_25613/g.44777 Transcript_25613/m.44777 type:complete len:219 (+) Transcript_25613:1968-2624(+)
MQTPTSLNISFDFPVKHSRTPEPRHKGAFNLVREVPQSHYTQSRFLAYHRAEERNRRLLKHPSHAEFDLANEVLKMFRTETPCDSSVKRPYTISRFPDACISQDLEGKCNMINAYQHIDLISETSPKKLPRRLSLNIRSVTPKCEKRPDERLLIDLCLMCRHLKCQCKTEVKDLYLKKATKRLVRSRKYLEAAKAKLNSVKSSFTKLRGKKSELLFSS